MIPLAALVGVMFMVVLGTFEWSSIRILGKIPKEDAFVIILVSTVTVFTDLAIAVACGVIASSLVFAWQRSETMTCKISTDDEGNKHYLLTGTLFFGSVQSFQELFSPKEDSNKIYMDFKYAKVCDYSSIEVINTIVDKYGKLDKEVYIKNLSPDCESVVTKAGHLFQAKIIHG